jgi:hypothetical protein
MRFGKVPVEIAEKIESVEVFHSYQVIHRVFHIACGTETLTIATIRRLIHFSTTAITTTIKYI